MYKKGFYNCLSILFILEGIMGITGILSNDIIGGALLVFVHLLIIMVLAIEMSILKESKNEVRW